jgi:hypothetical protein
MMEYFPEVGDIVQVIPGTSDWAPCLVVVSELKSFGIQGYTSIPFQGDAYIRLNRGEYEFTGGRVVFAPKHTGDTDGSPKSG